MTTHDAPAWYSRLSRAAHDVTLAGTYAGFALEIPAEPETDAPTREINDIEMFRRREGYVLAFIIAYARPFTRCKGWPMLDSAVLPYSDDERALHDRIMGLRHEFWAHTDAQHYTAMPIVSAGDPSDSDAHIMEEPLDLTDDELRGARVMIPKAAAYFQAQARPYRRELIARGVAIVDKP